MKLNKKLFIAPTAALLAAAFPAYAQSILPACATDPKQVLQLSCFFTLLIGISQWILGITGSLALLFFVYGGFVFLTSRGSSDQVQKGKTILTQAAIGIIIIFGAYLMVNFLVTNVLKANFTTEIPKEAPSAAATPATTPGQNTTPGQPNATQGQGVCACAVSSQGLLSDTVAKNLLNNVCQSLGGKYTEETNSAACVMPDVKDPAVCDGTAQIMQNEIAQRLSAVPGGAVAFCTMTSPK